ncbi:lysine biosynthesis protein LysW [Candidatus Shapirobacteria bacterium]|nr:lysine biosynthesis protein LysW [Candidatus Shapirobacteria bacterium]
MDSIATNKIICPDCSTEIAKPEGMVVGDILECQECGTEVEVQSLEPLKYSELVEEK